MKVFNRITEQLKLIVNDLRMRQRGLEKENNNCGMTLDEQEKQKKKFKDDIFDVI